MVSRSVILDRAELPARNMHATFTVAPIAMANYPKGAEIPILPPVLDQPGIWRATEQYVDGGVGTLDDLYRAIWGLGRDEYDDKIADLLD